MFYCQRTHSVLLQVLVAVLLESFFTDLGASKDAMHREESQVHRLDPLMEVCKRANAREREGERGRC